MATASTLSNLTEVYSERVTKRMEELQFALDVAQREGLGENRDGSDEIAMSVHIEHSAHALIRAMVQYLAVVRYK